MDEYFSIETQQKLLDTGEAFITLFVELTFLFIAISYFVALINQKISPEKIQKLLGARNGKGFLI